MKKAILLVAYGACSPQGRRCLSCFESLCRSRFGDWPIRWAYTSCILRDRLLRQKRKVDSVGKALMRLYLENFAAVAVQPLQTIAGSEHEEARTRIMEAQAQTGILCSIGEPLLAKTEDLPRVAAALLTHIPAERNAGESVIFMGHGARHAAGVMYARLDAALRCQDSHARIGAMNGGTGLEAILPDLSPGPVWLMPLLSTIGQHAIRDMAGPGPESWRSRIEQAGHACRPVLKGMAESPALCAIWLDHLDEAINVLGC